jgi:hypothetical protein
MGTHYLYHIDPPAPFPLTHPTGANPPSPGQDLFVLLFSDFVEEKREKRKRKA